MYVSRYSSLCIWKLNTGEDQNIRLTNEELGEWRNMPGLVELADKSGYYATLSAYHSLHCE